MKATSMAMTKPMKPSPMKSGKERMPTGPPAVAAALEAPAMAPATVAQATASKATVSNVLNGTGRVGEETRQRVLQIAEREGYVANFAAKSLRAAETRTVGIVTPDISNVFFSSIVMRLERELYNAGYASFACDTENDPQREASYIKSMLHKQVDGLVFVNGKRRLDLSALPTKVPTVVLDRITTGTHERFVSVDNDVRQMTHDMTKTLLDHGCTRIAFVSVSASTAPLTENARYVGYIEALAEAGARLDQRLVLRGQHVKPSNLEAEELVGSLLERGEPVDGIVAIGDRVAIGAMTALEEHGLNVGSDVLDIGCDDTPIARLFTPTLSSVNRNVDKLASRAAEALIALMNGAALEQTQIIVDHQVVERASTLGQ